MGDEQDSTPTKEVPSANEQKTSPSGRRLKVFWFIVGLIPALGLLLSFYDPFGFYATQDRLRGFVEQGGKWGWLIFVLIQAGQVVITPINHYVVGFLGGFLYGPLFGGLLNWIGRVAGHIIAFEISGRWGRRWAERRFGVEVLKKYDGMVSDKPLLLSVIYFVPFFPDDELSYLAGLSKMPRKHFILANLVGHIGGAWPLAYLGAGIKTYDWFFWSLIGLTFIGFGVIWYLGRRLKTEKEAETRATS